MSERPLPRRGLERLDLLLLAIEALDLHGSEAMLWCCDQLGLSGQFPDRVTLWRSRCRNPLRRASRRGQLGSDEARALITLACTLAQRVYPLLRQLVSSREPADLTAQRWALFRDRFSDLVRCDSCSMTVKGKPCDGPSWSRCCCPPVPVGRHGSRPV